jgi:hypothetical protein
MTNLNTLRKIGILPISGTWSHPCWLHFYYQLTSGFVHESSGTNQIWDWTSQTTYVKFGGGTTPHDLMVSKYNQSLIGCCMIMKIMQSCFGFKGGEVNFNFLLKNKILRFPIQHNICHYRIEINDAMSKRGCWMIYSSLHYLW